MQQSTQIIAHLSMGTRRSDQSPWRGREARCINMSRVLMLFGSSSLLYAILNPILVEGKATGMTAAAAGGGGPDSGELCFLVPNVLISLIPTVFWLTRSFTTS